MIGRSSTSTPTTITLHPVIGRGANHLSSINHSDSLICPTALLPYVLHPSPTWEEELLLSNRDCSTACYLSITKYDHYITLTTVDTLTKLGTVI